MRGGKSKIIETLNRANEIDVEEGRVAYFRYNAVCKAFAEFYGYDLTEVIAVFAALSPNNDYYGNLRSLASVLDCHKKGISSEQCRISTYNHCRERAFTYLNGVSFLETVKGEKIRSFYQNILNPFDPFPVTIDGHAVNIWRGKRVNLKKVAEEGGKWNYKQIADAYRDVARSVGLIPNQLQSITWFAWKRIHRIYYNPPQYELFADRTGDFWKTFYSPEEIKPFPLIVPEISKSPEKPKQNTISCPRLF